MIQILMLSWEYPPHVVGGLGRHVAELAPALVKQGIEVHVATPVTAQALQPVTVEQGVTIHRILTPPNQNPDDIHRYACETNRVLEAYLNQLRAAYGHCHLIHAHDWLTSFAGIALQNAWACPLVTTIHATERGRSRGFLNNQLQQAIDHTEHDLVNRARQVIVCSHYMANEVQYFFQTPPGKVDIVPNGVNVVDLQNGANQAELAEFRAGYAHPDDQIVFTIARLVYEKGIHLVVQAAPRVLNECPRARIIIAGKGPEADNLQQQARNLGVADRINFIGFISDVDRNRFFQVADCAIFPSLYEPFGIVALEAMALGCPLIVSDVGGFSEVVKHAETGIKIYPDNVDSTAWGIVHALNHPDWAKKHAANACQSVREVFSWPRIATLTLDVYRRVLDQYAGREPGHESI